MPLRFAKIVQHARPPEKLNDNDPGLTIFSAENFTVEFGEVHAYRTGIMLEVPKGGFGLLTETNSMGVQGVTVAGGLLTANDVREVRVNLINSHRNAFEVKAGMPIAQLILVESDTDEDEAVEFDLEGLKNEMNEAKAQGKAPRKDK